MSFVAPDLDSQVISTCDQTFTPNFYTLWQIPTSGHNEIQDCYYGMSHCIDCKKCIVLLIVTFFAKRVVTQMHKCSASILTLGS